MYKHIVNIVGVKKCISLCGVYSWPDVLFGVKHECEDAVRVGKYIVDICGFCIFIKSFFSAPAVL